MGCMAFHAPALLPKGQAPAAPRWNPKDSRGLVAPSRMCSGATAISDVCHRTQRLLRMVLAQANEVTLKTMPTIPSSMVETFTPLAKLRIMVTTDRIIAIIEST